LSVRYTVQLFVEADAI